MEVCFVRAGRVLEEGLQRIVEQAGDSVNLVICQVIVRKTKQNRFGKGSRIGNFLALHFVFREINVIVGVRKEILSPAGDSRRPFVNDSD